MDATPLSVLRELVAVKRLRDEYNRRKQRRGYVFRRDPDEVRAVDALLEECKAREAKAWAAAEAATR